MKKRIFGALGSVAIVGLALSGCAGDPLTPGATPAPGASEPSAELTKLSVVVAPIQFEPTYIALQEGYFAEEGLEVEIIPGGAPAANIARAVSGEVDITTGSLGTLVTSAAQNVPVVGIGGNGYTSPDHATSGIITMKSSGIDEVADLAGRTLGLQGLNSGSEIPVFLAAEDHGIDPLSIQRVELPSAGLETALVEGTIDSILVSAPQYNQIMSRDDVQLLSNPSTEYMAGTPVTVWVVHKDWLADNAETAHAFLRAMEKAQAYYEDPANLEAILDITAEVSQQDRASLSSNTLIPVSVAIDIKQANVQAEGFSRFGIVDKTLDIDEIIWPEAPRR